MISDPRILIGALVLTFAAGFGAAWSWQGSRGDAAVASANAAHADQLRTIAQTTTELIEKQSAKDKQLAAKIAAADTQHTTEMQDVRKNFETERADLLARRSVVRVHATIPACSDPVSAATTGASLGAGTLVELDPETGADISDIKKDIALDNEKLAFCQNILRAERE